MKKKTWKIGEYAKGGIISVEIVGWSGNIIQIIGKDWDFSTGSKKSSDQSNAKEFTRINILSTDDNAYRQLYDFLSDLTTHYYAETIIDWIKTKVEIKNNRY